MSLEDTKFADKIAKYRQSAYGSTRYWGLDYKVGSKLCINRSLFADIYSGSRDSERLGARRLRPSVVEELIGKNDVRLRLSGHFKINPIIHIIHAKPNL